MFFRDAVKLSIRLSAVPSRSSSIQASSPSAIAPVIDNRVLTPSEGKPELLPPATETAKNARIRTERRDAWWLAERAEKYWYARWKWLNALEIAQKYKIGDSGSFPPPAHASSFEAVGKWREAVAKQLLTPAPTLADVAWKRAKVKSDDFKQLPIALARAERAIAEDLAFLAAHPTRQSNSEAMARSREFKEAMRQRIREVAASRNLSDDEIKPALSLKHEAVGEFVEKHGVNWPWLLEGNGEILQEQDQ
jgi:hypothetical protein